MEHQRQRHSVDVQDVPAPRVNDKREGKKYTSNIPVLKKSWEKDFNDWKKRPILEDFVYLWCDGVNMQVRLGDDKRTCLLVVVGVTKKGEKKLLAVEGGYRESKESERWIFLKRLHAQVKFEANRQLGLFRSAFNDKYEKAYKCIDKDWEPLTGFFDFPASQWTSLIERAIQLSLSLPLSLPL